MAAANVLAHAAGGAALAGIAGGDVLAGAGAAAGGEIIADIVRNQFYAGKTNKELTEADKQNISNAAQLLTGLGAGLVSDNDGKAIATAVTSSKNAVENNRLTTLKENERIKELANNNEKAYLYYAAACALINCSKDLADDDPTKKAIQKLEELGNSEVLAKFREELVGQEYKETILDYRLVPTANGYKHQAYMKNISEPLFQYSFSDGVVQSGFGVAELVGSAALSPGCTTVVACAPSAVLAWSGTDNLLTGIRQA